VERHGAGAERYRERHQVGVVRITKDWTQNHDVSAANPEKLTELQDLFWVEAAKYQVLPLDASALTRFILPRPSIVAGRDELTYTKPIVGVPLGTAPSVLNKSFTITADIEVPQGGGNGMLSPKAAGSAAGAFTSSRASLCSSTTCSTSNGHESRAAQL
jgi:hypothetical protein